MCSRSFSKSSVCAWTYCRSWRPSSMIVWISAFSSATSRPGLKRSVAVAYRVRAVAARVHHENLGAALCRLLEEGRRDRVVFGRPRADDDDDVGIGRGGERRGHRARADPLHQRRHRRGVAQPGAVVDIVAAEPGAHQLLEEIGLLVRALGRAEPGQRPLARPGRGCASGPRRRGRAPLPRSPCGNACRGWPDRYRCRASRRRPCGSAARSAGPGGAT